MPDRTYRLLEAEARLRDAGRALELLLDEEHLRVARIAFRLAQRLRSERLEAAGILPEELLR